MNLLSSLPLPLSLSLFTSNTQTHPNPCLSVSVSLPKHGIKLRELNKLKAVSVSDVSTSMDPLQAQVTWQIVVGALAGVIPFIVAGIEFNKRIVAQRRCEVCGGSGLVLRDKKYYFRCPCCGGFLPWQSWKRFFSG